MASESHVRPKPYFSFIIQRPQMSRGMPTVAPCGTPQNRQQLQVREAQVCAVGKSRDAHAWH